jgi:hypothetical protein
LVRFGTRAAAGLVGSGVALAAALSGESCTSTSILYGTPPSPDCGPDVITYTSTCPTDASLDAAREAPEDAADAATSDAGDVGQPDAPSDAPLDVSAPEDASDGG